MESLAQVLKAKRKALKIRSVDLAKSLKIDQALISKYENNKRLPTKAQVKALSRILEIPYQELLVLYYKEFMLKYLSYDETSLKAIALVQDELTRIVKPSVKSKEKAITFSTKRLDKFHAKFAKLASDKKSKLSKEFWMSSIAHNIHFGGNTLSALEVKQIIEQGLTIPGKSLQEHFEVMNHFNLIQDFSGMPPLNSFDELANFHIRMFSGHSTVLPGKLNSKHAIDQEKWSSFFRELKQNWHEKHPLILASDARSFLLHEQTFENGNLQIANLFTNFILVKHDFLPVIIQREDIESQDYQKAWKAYNEISANQGLTQWLMTLSLQQYQKLFKI